MILTIFTTTDIVYMISVLCVILIVIIVLYRIAYKYNKKKQEFERELTNHQKKTYIIGVDSYSIDKNTPAAVNIFNHVRTDELGNIDTIEETEKREKLIAQYKYRPNEDY